MGTGSTCEHLRHAGYNANDYNVWLTFTNCKTKANERYDLSMPCTVTRLITKQIGISSKSDNRFHKKSSKGFLKTNHYYKGKKNPAADGIEFKLIGETKRQGLSKY